jgi:hypothetical protein
LLALVLVVTLTGSAFADGDILQQLLDLSRQAQGETQSAGGTVSLSSGAALVPDQSEVQMEVDLEAGDTVTDRAGSYAMKREAQRTLHPTDFANLVKLGFAYQMGSKHDKAKVILEQAIALEPTAQTVYDTLAQSLANVDPGLKVFVGGKRVVFDVEPTVIAGRTLVPIRAVADQLGATVSWNADTFTATVVLNGIKVDVTRDSKVAKVNGADVALDVPAMIMNGRTLLPIRFVSENLGQQVDYHASGTAGSAVISIVNR